MPRWRARPARRSSTRGPGGRGRGTSIDGDAGTAFGCRAMVAEADRGRSTPPRRRGWPPSSRPRGRPSTGSPPRPRRSCARAPAGAAATPRRSWSTSAGGDDSLRERPGHPGSDRRTPPDTLRRRVLADPAPALGRLAHRRQAVAAPLRRPADRVARAGPRLGDRGPHGARLRLAGRPAPGGRRSRPAGACPGRLRVLRPISGDRCPRHTPTTGLASQGGVVRSWIR